MQVSDKCYIPSVELIELKAKSKSPRNACVRVVRRLFPKELVKKLYRIKKIEINLIKKRWQQYSNIIV